MLIDPKRHCDVDTIARNLALMGSWAKNSPPAYRAGGCKTPVLGPNGVMGYMLDGVGLLMDLDLKDLGIHHKLPNVIERSPISRLLDKIGDERGAIATYDDIVNARASGNMSDCIASKTSYTTVANVWSSTFRAGGLPAAGTYSNIPGGAAPDDTNAGSIAGLLAGPASSTKEYLLTFGYVAGQQINCLLLVDLLVAAGNILCTTTSSQTVSSTALTRHTSGLGVYMTFEVTTALSTTAQNITVTYTNSSGTGSRSSGAQAMTTSAIAQRLLPIATGPYCPLASGDAGVQSVQSVVMSASNGAGVVALNLFRPLVIMPGIAANIYAERPMASTLDGLVELENVSLVLGCLTAYVFTNTTSTGILTMKLGTCWG